MNNKKHIFLGLLCLSTVHVLLYSPDRITRHGFGKAFNWRNGYGIISITQKNPNSTSTSQPASLLSTHNATEHNPLADDVLATTMLATTALDSTSRRTSYSAQTAFNTMKTTKSIKYEPQRNYSYILSRKLRQAMQDRFLFPVVLFGGGPNFQFRQLKTSIEFAVFTNRSIVISDFRHHRNKYNVSSVHFEETFNVSVLNQLLPTVNVKQFREKCGARGNTVLTFYNPRRSVSKRIAHAYRISRRWLSKRANVSIPDEMIVSFPKSMAESWRKFDKTADDRCVVMVSPLGFEAVQLPNKAAISDAIDRYLVRTSFLQKAVEDVLPKLCDGKPILGFHWRNKTGERCRIGMSHTNEPRCRKLLQMQCRTLESLALNISSIMSQENAGCIFLASAPREPREVNRLRGLYYVHFYACVSFGVDRELNR
ncbi:uncharacterized protein [Ptychodera flava]|uniref:uncharacterized protein n=1 Tax=Ptychodera flava TaxID=63121 RepID=UPI00396A6C82